MTYYDFFDLITTVLFLINSFKYFFNNANSFLEGLENIILSLTFSSYSTMGFSSKIDFLSFSNNLYFIEYSFS